MRKICFTIITMLVISTGIKAQQTTDNIDKDAVTFITNFYKNYFSSDGDLSDATIETLCTPKLLKKLKDLNEFEDGGYDITVFRSDALEGDGESALKNVRQMGSLTYLADILDMGHAATMKLTLVKTANGSFKIDDVERNIMLSDLPISDILKLIDYEVDAGDILKPAGYKYVGEFSSEASRSYIQTWCRNCTCNKRGDVLSFQKGTSSIVCLVMQMGSPTTLSIEVFNTNARDAIINELKASYFIEEKVENGGHRSFSRNNGDLEQTAMMEKSPKGWVFNIFPVACQ